MPKPPQPAPPTRVPHRHRWPRGPPLAQPHTSARPGSGSTIKITSQKAKSFSTNFSPLRFSLPPQTQTLPTDSPPTSSHPLTPPLTSASLWWSTARRVVVIHDVLVTCVVQDIATIPNKESYFFHPICAFTSFFDGCQFLRKPIPGKEPEGLPSLEGCYPLDILKFIALQTEFMGLPVGGIYNSSRSIKGTYIDIQTDHAMTTNHKLWAIGPLYPQIEEDTSSSSTNKCLEWLHKQDPKTVLYVSWPP